MISGKKVNEEVFLKCLIKNLKNFIGILMRFGGN